MSFAIGGCATGDLLLHGNTAIELDKLKSPRPILISILGGESPRATRTLSLPPSLHSVQGLSSLFPGPKGPNYQGIGSCDSTQMRAGSHGTGRRDSLRKGLWHCCNSTWRARQWSDKIRTNCGSMGALWLYSDGRWCGGACWQRGCVCGDSSKHRDRWLRGPMTWSTGKRHSGCIKQLILEFNDILLIRCVCRHALQLLGVCRRCCDDHVQRGVIKFSNLCFRHAPWDHLTERDHQVVVELNIKRQKVSRRGVKVSTKQKTTSQTNEYLNFGMILRKVNLKCELGQDPTERSCQCMSSTSLIGWETWK